ncbi:HD domain-containing protein, partial [Streptomyces fradiae]|uniref:HD domain-containing protein n=1 Tax=Streptomyces fradiae TaxID=1906 RepID=UPI0034060C77
MGGAGAGAWPGATDRLRRARGSGGAQGVLRFLAMSHDVGKCTPTFACQVEPLA